MQKENFEWEWLAFTGLVGGLIGMEAYAMKTRKIRPLSEFVWWTYKGRYEMNRYVIGGAWTGFCIWTIRHFFFDYKTGE